LLAIRQPEELNSLLGGEIYGRATFCSFVHSSSDAAATAP
jgi:hypothetical protein